MLQISIYDATQIQKPIIQYKETDWEFCKRMASHMGLPVYCNPSQREAALQIGIDAGQKPIMEIGQEYKASVKASSGKLGIGDWDIIEALMDDLEYAIRMFE